MGGIYFLVVQFQGGFYTGVPEQPIVTYPTIEAASDVAHEQLARIGVTAVQVFQWGAGCVLALGR